MMKTNPGLRRLLAASVAAVILAATGACGGGGGAASSGAGAVVRVFKDVPIAPRAATDFAEAYQQPRPATTMLRASQVETIASRTSVSPTTIESLTPQLDRQQAFRLAYAQLDRLAREYGPDVAGVALDVSCDVILGWVSNDPEAIEISVANALASINPTYAARNAAQQYVDIASKAKDSNNVELQLTILTFCVMAGIPL